MSEVVIVGGGPAGAAAAIALARAGLKPVVLDAGPGLEAKVGECLPPLANPLLEQLGLTDWLESDGHVRSYGVRSVWGSADLGERDFLFGSSGPGWHVDRLAFEARLSAVARVAGAQWRDTARLVGVHREGRRWAVAADTPAGRLSVAADYLVDATGRRAVVVRQLGASRTHHDRLVGIAGTLRSPDPDPAAGLFSLVEAVPGGWWYSAPLPGGQLAVVYMTDADLPGSRVARTAEGWRRLLRGAGYTSRRVADGRYREPQRLRTVTATTSRLAWCAGDGWAAVGDAAATFDPLSSHGIYSALAGGFQVGRAITRALSGDPADLRGYPGAVDRAFREYLALRLGYYTAERRWPAEPFWHRRHQATAT